MNKYNEAVSKWMGTVKISKDDPYPTRSTTKLPINDPRVPEIINMLKEIDVDGETMEYIIRQVGLEDQMLKQLSGE